MNWSSEQLASVKKVDGFYMRGESMTRIEVFCDAAFAFAMTMLVVSVGSIPSSFDELIVALKNVPAFALSFLQIAAFWFIHRLWSQRYGLETFATMSLSLLMIFIIMVFVYPLRLFYSLFFEFISGGWLPSEFTVTDIEQVPALFVIYGVGFSAITAIIGSLYLHAYKLRQALSLTQYEETRPCNF